MSWAFITALRQNPQQSYVQLLNSIRDVLATKYTQRPQLSSSHPLGEWCAEPLLPDRLLTLCALRRHESPLCHVTNAPGQGAKSSVEIVETVYWTGRLDAASARQSFWMMELLWLGSRARVG